MSFLILVLLQLISNVFLKIIIIIDILVIYNIFN